jgi:hypothetical protein
MSGEIDTTNDHLVGIQGGRVVVVMPPLRPMAYAEALRLAAWIVAIVDDDEAFNAILGAVRST